MGKSNGNDQPGDVVLYEKSRPGHWAALLLPLFRRVSTKARCHGCEKLASTFRPNMV
jgi:hypothetical protein